MIDKFRNWIELFRVQTMFVTILALWVGYVTTFNYNLVHIFELSIVGALIHMGGFSMNEIFDYRFDMLAGIECKNPISRGDVDLFRAKVASAFCIILAWLLSLHFGSLEMAIVFILAIISGTMYNRLSKKLWWSNFLLSGWVFFIVVGSAYMVESPNILTILVGLAMAIQIFVQVIEGDIKDLNPHEESFSKKLGVRAFFNMKETDSGVKQVIKYEMPRRFGAFVIFSKIVEYLLLVVIAYQFFKIEPDKLVNHGNVWVVVFIISSVSYLLSASMIPMNLEYENPRVQIKKLSSIHELSSIVLLGTVFSIISPKLGVLFGTIPLLWYLFVNKLLYSDSLNPSI